MVRYIYLSIYLSISFQKHDPDRQVPWENMGKELGLEIVAEVEEEIVAQEDKTRRQNKMLSGNYGLTNNLSIVTKVTIKDKHKRQ